MRHFTWIFVHCVWRKVWVVVNPMPKKDPFLGLTEDIFERSSNLICLKAQVEEECKGPLVYHFCNCFLPLLYILTLLFQQILIWQNGRKSNYPKCRKCLNSYFFEGNISKGSFGSPNPQSKLLLSSFSARLATQKHLQPSSSVTQGLSREKEGWRVFLPGVFWSSCGSAFKQDMQQSKKKGTYKLYIFPLYRNSIKPSIFYYIK